MISHDIRQSLANVMTTCELVLHERDLLTQRHQDALQTIHASAGIMHHLIDDMLPTYANSETLPIKIDPLPIDFVRLVHKAVITNNIVASKKNVTINFSISKKSPDSESCWYVNIFNDICN